ncbi:hypothetical protein K435DRAFT_838415 [Dendrothele bispora CBS 962.96]|uniref:Uncharacterized protein n=1 Tax=Dendrothele bispora (strain CBS 962.96) TaxID=1314807 RepID=A0A4S8M7M0_DENBC|nr:hypothetical protein K435DRAFT_838415 [Dendrothele bispora CBS 962.96]
MHYGHWGRVIGDIELLVSHQSSASVTTESTGYFVYMSFHSLLMGPKFCSAARLRPLMSSWLFYSYLDVGYIGFFLMESIYCHVIITRPDQDHLTKLHEECTSKVHAIMRHWPVWQTLCLQEDVEHPWSVTWSYERKCVGRFYRVEIVAGVQNILSSTSPPSVIE